MANFEQRSKFIDFVETFIPDMFDMIDDYDLITITSEELADDLISSWDALKDDGEFTRDENVFGEYINKAREAKKNLEEAGENADRFVVFERIVEALRELVVFLRRDDSKGSLEAVVRKAYRKYLRDSGID